MSLTELVEFLARLDPAGLVAQTGDLTEYEPEAEQLIRLEEVNALSVLRVFKTMGIADYVTVEAIEEIVAALRSS